MSTSVVLVAFLVDFELPSPPCPLFFVATVSCYSAISRSLCPPIPKRPFFHGQNGLLLSIFFTHFPPPHFKLRPASCSGFIVYVTLIWLSLFSQGPRPSLPLWRLSFDIDVFTPFLRPRQRYPRSFVLLWLCVRPCAVVWEPFFCLGDSELWVVSLGEGPGLGCSLSRPTSIVTSFRLIIFWWLTSLLPLFAPIVGFSRSVHLFSLLPPLFEQVGFFPI